MANPQTYACANCGRTAPLTHPLPPAYPFCSDRCRRVDLGRWFGEQYVIERDISPEELADMDDQRPPRPPD